jgi:molybdopterin synthase catalytic subunit
MTRFELSGSPIDVAALRQALDDPHCGAVASFEGIVRDHNNGRAVLRLDYQSYAELAQREGQAIVDAAAAATEVRRIICVHRVGALAIGDVAVWVGVAAAHRGAAFDACRRVIDEVKLRVPIWKNEHYADGDSGWIHPES